MITAGMLAIFDCVVRQQPAEAAAMLSQPVESDAERSAFSKLRPAFAACLPPDQQFKMRASNVRPFIAETFYTLTRLSGGSAPPVSTEPAGAD